MIFPIGDDQVQGGAKPYVSYSFIAINVLIFLFQFSLDPESLRNFIYTFGSIPNEIRTGQDLFTLFTNMFLHGGWMHLIGNMVFLWIFADNIEATVGNVNFVIFYVMGGVIASLIHFLSDTDSTIPAVGASGAIAACLGAYLVMFPKSKIKILVIYFFKSFKVPAFVFLGIWIIQELISGIGTLGVDTETGGVAYWAHIGGFFFGLVAGYFAKQSFIDNNGPPNKPSYV